MDATIKSIKKELHWLGWLCTNAEPCGYSVVAENQLPRGWVRIYDDWSSGYYDGADILARLRRVEIGAEYGSELTDEDFGEPDSVARWPSDLISFEQLERGNGDEDDNPATLITIETNGGRRFIAGPHGASCDALMGEARHGDWLNLCKTREAAINRLQEASSD